MKKIIEQTMKLYSYILIFLLIFCSQNVFSQHLPTPVYEQLWFTTQLNWRLNPKWELTFDASLRSTEWAQYWRQQLFRGVVAYKIHERVNVSGGMAFFRNYPPSGINSIARMEFRPHQQAILTDNYGRLQLRHRFRIEERWIQKTRNGETIDEYDYTTRFRYQLYFLYPLGKAQKYSFFLFDEILIQTGSSILINYFDQNRTSIGLIRKFNAHTSLTAQYMHMIQQTNTLGLMELQPIFHLTLGWNY
jgi:Protein of unknown function (DUF2490)